MKNLDYLLFMVWWFALCACVTPFEFGKEVGKTLTHFEKGFSRYYHPQLTR